MLKMNLALLALLLLVATSGCYLRPNLGPPGTIGMQRNRAVLHDPYPSDVLGPAVVGGRPRGFDLPQPTTKNLQEVSGAFFNATPVYQQPQIQPGY